MYLFSITEKKYDSDFTFNNLTQNDTIDLTDNRLKQFLSNIVSNKDTIINKKISTFFKDGMKEDSYNYNQFNKLNINWDSKFIFTQAIGQKLVIRKNYPFIANPYNNKIMDEFLKRTEENIISTQNAYLLFKYSPIKDNNIYYESIGVTQNDYFEFDKDLKISVKELYEINNKWYNNYNGLVS